MKSGRLQEVWPLQRRPADGRYEMAIEAAMTATAEAAMTFARLWSALARATIRTRGSAQPCAVFRAHLVRVPASPGTGHANEALSGKVSL